MYMFLPTVESQQPDKPNGWHRGPDLSRARHIARLHERRDRIVRAAHRSLKSRSTGPQRLNIRFEKIGMLYAELSRVQAEILALELL